MFEPFVLSARRHLDVTRRGSLTSQRIILILHSQQSLHSPREPGVNVNVDDFNGLAVTIQILRAHGQNRRLGSKRAGLLGVPLPTRDCRLGCFGKNPLDGIE